MGWRIGGKGASGRGINGRIEEHGIHLWLGFYDNAFRTLRECYAELERNPDTCPISSFEQAFSKESWISVTEKMSDSDWQIWSAKFPAAPGLPGDPIDSNNPLSLPNYFARAVQLLFALLKSIDDTEPEGEALETTGVDELKQRLDSILKYGQLITVTAVVEALAIANTIIRWNLPGYFDSIETLLKRIQETGHMHLTTLARGDDLLRRLWIVIDLVLACLRGIFRFSLYNHPMGFDAINDYGWQEWLKLNGAGKDSAESAFVRGSCYDLTFAYREGDGSKPAMAAGVALRGASRMFFTFRGSLFWRMNAGMGDIVFAPIYEVLKARGVKFKFFHKLTNVQLGQDDIGEHVAGLSFDIQANSLSNGEYNPLVDINGLPCWPALPLYKQLENGSVLQDQQVEFESQNDMHCIGKKNLKVNKDFDFVVLAVSLGTIPVVCNEIISSNQHWSDMVENVGTVSTQALQIWMNESMTALGYSKPAGTLSGFVSNFNTWADMTSVMSSENWQQTPESLAYFCSALPDNQISQNSDMEEVVMQNAQHFLNQHVSTLWPNAVDENGKFREDLIVPDGLFISANYNHSDRYVQSLPGTIRYRISPLDRHYDNLTIAGDWTHNGLDAGCVETAVISGMLAAHAVSEYPPLDEIVGFDHP
jgi:uncharacterized protein with NAD-binding domain and iron-sulfur cluster